MPVQDTLTMSFATRVHAWREEFYARAWALSIFTKYCDDSKDWRVLIEEFHQKGGKRIPPVTVFCDGETYRLYRGFARVAAARIDEVRNVEALVRPGGLTEMTQAAPP
jgi:hypothetical protein